MKSDTKTTKTVFRGYQKTLVGSETKHGYAFVNKTCD